MEALYDSGGERAPLTNGTHQLQDADACFIPMQAALRKYVSVREEYFYHSMYGSIAVPDDS